PQWMLTVISSLILLSFLFLIVQMITMNIKYLSNTLPIYEANVNKIAQSINQKFDLELSSLISEYINDLYLGGILTRLFSTLTSLFGDTFIVLIYLIFLLFEEPTFPKKLQAMYPEK